MTFLDDGNDRDLVNPLRSNRSSEASVCRHSWEVQSDPPNAKGLTLAEAVMTSFNSGVGPTLSVVAYAASLCGYVGFLFVLLVATLTAIVEQQTLMRASVECNATTFQEMCRPIPAWARQTTIWSSLIYLGACAGFYTDFLASFLEGQVCPLLCAFDADAWLCQSRWHLVLPVLILTFLVGSPNELSGKVSRGINVLNALVKAVVILAAIIKGTMTWLDSGKHSVELTVWRSGGFLRATSILMSSLANSGIMPQLAADLRPDLRAAGRRWCPIIAVSSQSLVYVFVALAGYAALGSAVDLDLFKVYEEKYPDFLSSILQGGIAMMIYLNLPLVSIPVKSQVWKLCSASLPLAEAPWCAKGALSLAFSVLCVAVPTAVGAEVFGSVILTIASTAGVWMNLLLPAVILFYSDSRNHQHGAPAAKRTALAAIGWIVFLGVLCLVDGIIKMVEPQHVPKDPILSEECRKAFDRHHPDS